MPFRRITLTLLIGLLLLASPVLPAQAASANWLAKACTAKVHASCTVIPASADSLLRDRRLVFHDSRGHTVTVAKRAAVWRLAVAHSKPCPPRGYQTGCQLTNEPGIGRSIVLPDGMSIALRLFRS